MCRLTGRGGTVRQCLDQVSYLGQRMDTSLPADGEVRLGSVLLPEGKQISGWTADPLLWVAPGQEEVLSPAELAQAVGSIASARIGLVPAPRPADVLALVGFNGTANRYGPPAPLAAVLRSWEQRFGAALLEVGFGHIRLLVQRPPRTLPAARAAAAEIWAMCDEFWAIEESRPALRNVSDIADYLVGAPFWSLWLD
jgi:Domain of unknown function (DUF4253)